MRILYCNKYNFRFSGTEAYLFDAMAGMRACGHEVALFSTADPRGAAEHFEQHLAPRKELTESTNLLGKLRFAANAIYSVAARARMRATIAAFRPDVAHVRNIYHHLSPSILWELKARGIPVIYHVNDFKLLCPAYNLVSRSGEICERCAGGRFWNCVAHNCSPRGRGASTVLAAEAYVHRWLRTYENCVDLLLAPSRFVKEKFMEHGWPESKTKVLPHFQNLAARRLPHPKSDAPILYFGRLSPEKGVQDLIAAMTQLPDVRLVIAGDGPQRHDLERLATKLNLGNVSFAGHVGGAALDTLIAQSQFTVFSSRAYETFGKSILESYAQGRAVVASDLGSRREVVENGRTGILYPVGDHDALARAIRFLRDRPEMSRAMGEAGWRRVRDQHSQVEHFLVLEKLYAALGRESQERRWATEKRIRVAFVGGRGIVGKYSGVESHFEEIGKRLAKRGHAVTVYCRSYFTPELRERDGMRIVRLPTIRTKHLDTAVHTLLSTAHACFSGCYVVHYQTLGPALFSFIPRMFGKQTVVTVQGLDWQRKKWSWPARTTLRVGEWAACHFPNRTIVVSHTLEDRYRFRKHARVTYVPNGAILRDRQELRELRKFGLRPDEYVLFLGRLSPEKNCDLLIKAFAGISTTFKLVLAGASSHTDGYAESLKNMNDDRVIFTGWLAGDALDEALTNAAVFVLPSDLEGLSLSLLDAMGARRCVLASDIPENVEAVGDAGFVFRRGDAEDLRRQLTMLIADKNLRENTGERAQERARKMYSWDEIAKQTEKIYSELTGRTSGSDRLTAPAKARARSA